MSAPKFTIRGAQNTTQRAPKFTMKKAGAQNVLQPSAQITGNQATAPVATTSYTQRPTDNLFAAQAYENQLRMESGQKDAGSWKSRPVTVTVGGSRGGYTQTKEVQAPTLLGRVADTASGAGKQWGAGGVNALGTTQAVTGGVARQNYLETDIQQWQNELARYEYNAAQADTAEERAVWEAEAEKVRQSLRMAGENMEQTKTAGQGTMALADRLSESGAQDLEAAKQGLGAFGQFAVDAGAAGLQMLGDIGVGALTGGGALVPMAIRGFGGGAQEARQAGASLGQQLAYGAGSAGVSVLTERLGNLSKPFAKAFGKGVSDDLVGGLINRAVQRFAKTAGGQTAMNALLRTGASFLEEGAEEFLEGVVDPFLRRATFDQEAQFDFEEAVYDFLVGGVLGGLGGGVETVSGARADYQGRRETAAGAAVDAAYDTMANEGMFSQAARQAAQRAQAQFVEPAGPRLTDLDGSWRNEAGEKMFQGVEESRQSEFRQAEQIAANFGAQFRVGKLENGAAGEYRSGIITIDPTVENPVRQVLIHELTHHMETSGLYGDFSQKILRFVAEDMGKNIEQARASIIREYGRYDIKLTEEDANRELVAKFAESNLFRDEASIRRLLQTDRNLFQRIYDWLQDTLVKVRGTSEERFIRDAQRLYEQALRQAGQQNTAQEGGVVQVGQENTVPEGGVVQVGQQNTAPEGGVAQVGQQNTAPEGGVAKHEIKEIGGRLMLEIDTENDTRMQVDEEKAEEQYLEILANTENPFSTILRDKPITYYGYRPDTLDGWVKDTNPVKEAKVRAATNIRELPVFKFDGTRLTKTNEHRNWQKDEAWFKCDVEFAVPVMNANKELSHHIVYSRDLEFKTDTAGTPYLYKLTNLKEKEKEKVRSASPSTAETKSEGFEQKPSPQQNAENEGGVKGQFSLNSPTEETRNLLALHNLTESNLRNALALGGLPMPSIAIVQAQQGHAKYGPISLVFSKDTIDPRADRRNRVYGGDAWTPTAPTIQYEPNSKAEQRIHDKYYELARRIGYDAARPLYNYATDLEDTMNRNGGEQGIMEKLRDDTRMMNVFLADSGKSMVENVQKETVTRLDDEKIRLYDYLIDRLGEDVINEMSTAGGETPMVARRRWMEAHGNALEAAYRDYLQADGIGTDAGFNRSDLAREVTRARSYLVNGPETRRTDFDSEATEKAIRDAVDKDAYEAWLRETFGGIEGRRGIYNGRDPYTSSGNRRPWKNLHYAYTLENIVQAMTDAQEERGQGTWGVGATSLQAVAAHRYGSIQEIKADSGRLGSVDSEAYTAAVEAVDRQIGAIIEKVRSTNKARSDNSLIETDHIAEALKEAAGGTKTVDAITRTFAESGYDISKETAQDIQAVYRSAAELPTEYFEAKPRRAVGFEEVLAAVVPDDMDAALRSDMERAGMNVVEYKSGDDADRLAKVNSLEDAKFSIGRSFDELMQNLDDGVELGDAGQMELRMPQLEAVGVEQETRAADGSEGTVDVQAEIDAAEDRIAALEQEIGRLRGDYDQRIISEEMYLPEKERLETLLDAEIKRVDELTEMLSSPAAEVQQPAAVLPGGAETDGYMEALARDENDLTDPITPADRIYDARLRGLQQEEAPPEVEPWVAAKGDLDDLMRLYQDIANPVVTPKEAAIEVSEALISPATPKERKTARQSAAEAQSFFVRKMVDAGDSVSKIGKSIKDSYLYPFYNMARSSASAGINMIQGEQTDITGQRVGESLNDIFTPIRERGADYYTQFQTFMFDLHNIDRMSLVGPDNPARLEAEMNLRAFDMENPDVAQLTEARLQRRANNSLHPEDEELARERIRLLRKLNQADRMGNKPVFSFEVTADMSRERSARLLREHPEFAKYQEQVRGYVKNLMQYRVDSGLMTAEDAAFLEKYYPNYVPTFRQTEKTPRGRDRRSVQVGKTVGRAEGGNQKLTPLHEALGKQTMQVVREGSKNRFGARLLEDFRDNSRNEQVRRYILDAQEYESDFSTETFDQADVELKKDNTFAVYKDGKKYEMTVDPSLFDAVKALSPDAQESNVAVKAIRAGNNLFKALVTGYNPTFTVRNVVRDLQTAGLYSRDAAAFAKNYPLALREIANDGPLWKQYKALGGSFSSVFDYKTGTVQESSKAVQKTLGRVEALNMAMEQAPRLAEFMSIVKAGDGSMENLMDAMHAAADVTVNFGRSGTLGKVLNANFVPFLNPGIQGFDRMVRRVTETKGGKEWAKLAIRAAALGIAPTVINGLLYADDDDWEDLKDSDKDTNYMFKIGDGLWLKIPKGRELSILGMTADRIQDIVKGEDVSWRDFIATVGNQVAPANPLKTNIVSAFVDSDLLDPSSPGRTWYGGDIESQRLQNYAPGERYDSSTDVFSKWVGQQLGISPKKINYLLDQYTGVLGDFLLPILTPQAERNMFSKAFTVDSVSSNKISGQFYDKSDELTYAKSGGDATAKVASRFWSKQQSACSDIYTKIREIEESDLSDAEKKQQVREARAVLNGIQKNALDVLDTYEAAVTKHLRGDSDEAVEAAYREANRECFGAEYALQVYNKDVYAKAQQANQNGVEYEEYYTYYFDTRGYESRDGKSVSTQRMEYLAKSDMSEQAKAEIYFADLASDSDLSKQAELETSAGIQPEEYWQYKVATSGMSKKAEKLVAINGLDLTVEQKDALYFANNWAASTIGEAPWHDIMPKLTGGSSGGQTKVSREEAIALLRRAGQQRSQVDIMPKLVP